MAKRIKMKDLLKENFSGTMLGGIVSIPAVGDISMSKIVKEKYGEIGEEKIDIKGLTTEISSYNKLGEAIFGDSNITKIAEKLSWIAGQAKSHTLSETEEWFDRITVNRNMKELTGLSNSFGKIAGEAKSLQERMGALYEDMGNILGRYYEIGEKVTEGPAGGKGDKDEYQKFFRMALKKFGVSEPDELDDDKKKEFYNYIDSNWAGDDEKQEVTEDSKDPRLNSLRSQLSKLRLKIKQMENEPGGYQAAGSNRERVKVLKDKIAKIVGETKS